MGEMERKKKKQNRTMLLRANLLFVVVFFLFSILVLRLGYVQMVQGKDYVEQIERTDDHIIYHPVPRGEIYDRNGHALVYNVPQKAITYTPPKNPQPIDILNTAEQLSEYIQMNQEDIENVPAWVKKEIWILKHHNGNEKITKEEEALIKKQELSEQELYKKILERITEEEIETINGNVAAIYQNMRSAVALTPSIIKNEGVTDEEFASVSENLDNLPGISTTTDWQRDYTYGQVFQSVLGRMKEGLPPEKLDYYSAKGYALNDRYGASYLEELYEDVLSGSKIQEKVITDNRGKVVSSEIISEGEPGRDLFLTIDINFQQEIEQIIQEELLRAIQFPRTETLDRMFVVAMDPRTGEILALAGKRYNRETKEFEEFSHGTFTQAFEAGSTVKGAMVLTGYQTGVLKPGEQKNDTPLILPGNTKSSFGGNALGVIDELKALERSSNVYMWLIALDVMEGRYVPGSLFSLNPEKVNTIRYYFSQFGLGTTTGIGFKEEIEGMKASPDPAQQAAFLDIAIGQFDTYTPLQLAQYVATIANDGYRVKPMLVKEIRSADLDKDGISTVIKEFQPTILNRVDMKQEWIERVQQGFWQVTHGSQGTARRYFSGEPYDVAGKTGTAQSYYVDNGRFEKGVETNHSSFVGYAPYDDPEIAISVIVPHAFYGSQPFSYTIGSHIAQRVFQAYFK